jgi:hypothetical protein
MFSDWRNHRLRRLTRKRFCLQSTAWELVVDGDAGAPLSEEETKSVYLSKVKPFYANKYCGY